MRGAVYFGLYMRTIAGIAAKAMFGAKYFYNVDAQGLQTIYHVLFTNYSGGIAQYGNPFPFQQGQIFFGLISAGFDSRPSSLFSRLSVGAVQKSKQDQYGEKREGSFHHSLFSNKYNAENQLNDCGLLRPVSSC